MPENPDVGDLAVENYVDVPRLVERRCGGWLAISGAREAVKVGVTAETEADAVELFDSTIRAWRLALSKGVFRG